MLNLKLSIRTARLQLVLDALDAAATPGAIEFYTGPKPAAGAAITTEILIGTLVLSQPAGTITGDTLTFDAISDDISADADGDIAWARASDGNGVWVFDGDCAATGTPEAASALFVFNTLTARLGGIIQILSGALVEGNG